MKHFRLTQYFSRWTNQSVLCGLFLGLFTEIIVNFRESNVDVAETAGKKSLRDVAQSHGASTEPLPYEGAQVVAALPERKFAAFE